MVMKCGRCQKFGHAIHGPLDGLNSISSLWLFTQWGIDIVDPLSPTPVQKKFLLVTIDYFTKWIEAKPYAHIKDIDLVKFVWKNIVCHFGTQRTVVSDSGPQFDSTKFRQFYQKHRIRNAFSTPRFPQSNGHAEASNKTLLFYLKKNLDTSKEKDKGIASHATGMQNHAQETYRRTPFAMVYNTEVVIPKAVE